MLIKCLPSIRVRWNLHKALKKWHGPRTRWHERASTYQRVTRILHDQITCTSGARRQTGEKKRDVPCIICIHASAHLWRPAESSAAVVAQIFGTRSISARTLKVSNVCHLRAHANFPISTRRHISWPAARRSISPIISPGVVRSQWVYAQSRSAALSNDADRETSPAYCSKRGKNPNTLREWCDEITNYFIKASIQFSVNKLKFMSNMVCKLHWWRKGHFDVLMLTNSDCDILCTRIFFF